MIFQPVCGPESKITESGEAILKLNHKSRDKKALVFSLSVNCVCGSKAKEAKMALSSSKSDASSHIIIVPWSL